MKQIKERTPPPKNATPKVYRDYLRNIKADHNYYERGLGYMSWLTGCSLERAKRSTKVKRGDYQKIVEAVGLSQATAYNCRRIYKSYTRVNSMRMGYTEMLRKLGWTSLDTKTDIDQSADPESNGGGIGSSRTKKITIKELNPILDTIANSIRAIKAMPMSALEPDKAKMEYEVARTTLTRIKTDCERSIRFMEERINSMSRKSKTKLRIAS